MDLFKKSTLIKPTSFIQKTDTLQKPKLNTDRPKPVSLFKRM